MKNLPLQLFVVAMPMFMATLEAQEITNPDVQSFTNADLNQNPQNPNNNFSTIPGSTQNPNTSSKYPALTADQTQQINDQMNAQLQMAEQRVQNLMSKVQDATRMPMSMDKVELESAITDLEVKKTLVSKFTGTPSLRSPKVRQVLLQILSKNFIQEADLATLQNIVNEERPYTYP